MQKNKNSSESFNRIINSRFFGFNYAFASLVILLGTTFLWALLSAKLQQNNADQLVNPYLLEHSSVFRGAVFPAAHTFLLKWPLFYLVKIFGYSTATYAGFTIAIALLTVASLAAIIYKIEKRPLVFGTLCLALASVLLLVPAQPYAGGLLPVNMAMLTTRNIEYLFYIAGLALIVKSSGLHSRKFWIGASLLGLLAASDRLFLLLAVGGGLIALVVYALKSRWDVVSLSVRTLVGGALAGLGALALLWLINLSDITNLGAASGPYGLVQGLKNLVLGSIYAVAGLFTNFGANPAYDATIVRNIPHQFFSRLFSLSGPAYVVNAAILFAGLFVVGRLIGRSLATKPASSSLDNKSRLSLMLVWSSLAAVGIFVLSNHYYAVDARYLTITLFAVFISLANFASQRVWRLKDLVIMGAVIICGILFGFVSLARTYQSDNNALADTAQRNNQVAQVIQSHPVDVLVGDYWRVVPTRLVSGNKINILPLAKCSQPLITLSSQSWQVDLNKHSFAYLLTIDGSLTDFPKCSLNQVVAAYGRPNASVLIAGSLSNPKELVLFYDNGIHKSAPKTIQPAAGPSTVVPISLDQLPPGAACSGPSSMNIVAHQDDDLLFMNPDIIRDIKGGRCVHTVYITAGDDGASSFYWLAREQGSEAAYSRMLGAGPVWIQRIVKLSNNEYITIANPKGSQKISLIFMHLPDGDLNGGGFDSSHHESLQKLQAGTISVMHSVDHQSVYSSGQLTAALTDLMYVYQPTEIRTQANFVSKQYPDHSDHMAVGRFVKLAYAQYEKEQFDNQVTIPLKFYIGYPVHAMPVNVSDGDLQAKEAAFAAYAKFDGNVCQTAQAVQQIPTYGSYLKRQYQNAY